MKRLTRNQQRLLEFLLSLPDDEAMTLESLDGYIAGILVCPELILPSEWLAPIWGADFDNVDYQGNAIDIREMTELVMMHYNSVARSLQKGAHHYKPLFPVVEPHDDILWEIWIDGFERALFLRPDAWDEILEGEDEEARESLAALLSLKDIANRESTLDENDRKQLAEAAPSLIPLFVQDLNRWRLENRVSEKEQQRIQRGGKIGRNDPCPCGSGRKYKKCCGQH